MTIPRLARRVEVLEAVGGQVVTELGDLASLRGASKYAVLAHFSVKPSVTKSVRELLRAFRRAGYATLVVSACEHPAQLPWRGLVPDDIAVLRKPNIGYDFGSWAVGLALLPEIPRADHVILANDSLLGPFAPLDELLSSFEGTTADVWGMTDTYQFMHHLQSYFMGFRGGVLNDSPLRRFWRSIHQEASKRDIIWRNELGLSHLLHHEGYSAQAAFRADEVVVPGENPTILGWMALLERGFPFVKREVVTNPAVAPNSDRVASVVRDLYRTDLATWC